MNATVRQPAPRADALRLLDRAASEGVEATLIVGRHLSRSGDCFLARWDGRELVVRELTNAQQHDWSIKPNGLFQQLEPATMPHAPLSSSSLVSLVVAAIEVMDEHDGRSPLSGTCLAEPVTPTTVIVNGALRAPDFSVRICDNK